MEKKIIAASPIQEFSLWGKLAEKRVPIAFDLEITARCNNNCRHCYINLPAGDKEAKGKELTLSEIEKIADQAVELGSLWCLISGGEPLLREDFSEIYLMLKKKGLLVSVFTNACLINEEHITLFKEFPPREIEVTVYGVTRETYEAVTRKPGSYAAFKCGFDLLKNNAIKVRLKAMALRSNIHELPAISVFCRRHTRDYFRFDPLLHLRFDLDRKRNREIISQRLTAEEIAKLEQNDTQRSDVLKKHCDQLIFTDNNDHNCQHLFHCGAGNSSFTVSSDGYFRLCASLWHPECIYDLKKGTLAEAWEHFVPQVRGRTSDNPEFLNKCRSCSLINLCLWCPAHAYLEQGTMEESVEYFCQVAHARAEALRQSIGDGA